MMSVSDTNVPLTERQRMVQRSIRSICEDYGLEYWRQKSANEEYPQEFVNELASDGWMGILIPEAYGGAGFSTPETVVMMEEIARNGGGFSAAQAIHGGIYNSVPLVEYGSEKMKAELLPTLASGDEMVQAFCLTEPNAGSESTAIETRAERCGDGWVLNGQKIWTSRIDVSDYAVVVARTTPRSEVEKTTNGISLFLVDIDEATDRGCLSYKEIPKTASEFVHSYEVWFEEVTLPDSALIGEEGEGFYHVLDGLNEERLVIAAECLGLGELALERGVQYAKDREVFGRPIGKNQAIQHPLAKGYAHLQAAKSLVYSAADVVDQVDSKVVGARANIAKYLAAEAAFKAADAAVQTHGGFGVAREYDVERYLREARLTRLVPITQELVLNYIGETVLGLPRSY